MFRLLFSFLLSIGSLYAQGTLTLVAGGGGDESYGGGNLDGISSSAAFFNPESIALTTDNNLIVGDNYGIKQISLTSQSVSTLYLFDTTHTVYDIEVDSSGNIYASVGAQMGSTDASTCYGASGTITDLRIYKFSSNGSLLHSWRNPCDGSEIDFSAKYLALDNSDNAYTITYNGTGTTALFNATKTTITQLNNDGTTTAISDITANGAKLENIKELEYNDGAFYISSDNYLKKFTPNSGTTEVEKVGNIYMTYFLGIAFDTNGDTYISSDTEARKLFYHGDDVITPRVGGLVESHRDTLIDLANDDIGTGIDALGLSNFRPHKIAVKDKKLYFSSWHKIYQIDLTTNTAPSLTIPQFPQEVSSYSQKLEFDPQDSDGYVAKIYCDFGDGNGEQSLYTALSDDRYASNTSFTLSNLDDGTYQIECAIYDNEGATSAYTKEFSVGDVVESQDDTVLDDTTQTDTASDDPQEDSTTAQSDVVAQSIAGLAWLANEPDGYFSWSEANAWCEDQGYRLPTMDELIAAWNAGGGVASPAGFEKDTFYWASGATDNGHEACSMDHDCSSPNSWPDDGFGHPKCVIADATAFDDGTIPTTSQGGDEVVADADSATISIVSGWNLLASVINDTLMTLNNHFHDYEITWVYSNQDGWSSNPATITKGAGFWLKSNTAYSVTNSASYDITIPTTQGWHLLGAGKDSSISADNVSIVWIYGQSGWQQDPITIQSGQGFWVKVTEPVASTTPTTDTSTSSSTISWGNESGVPFTFDGAKLYCDLAGQRLPTKAEAQAEYYATGLAGFEADYFWTGEMAPDDGYHSGYIYTYGKDYASDTMWPDNDYLVYVRCVKED
jgi:hypothetical protein